jgi:MSHA biogenesis protein MshL
MKKLILSIPLLFTLAGCATPELAKVPDTMALGNYSSPVKAVAASAVPTDRKGAAYLEVNKGKKYSLTLKETDIRDVLILLSKDSPLPIVAEGDVSGKVSIILENKRLGDVLYAVLRPLGYTATIENGVIVVSKPKLVTRTFRINYLKDKRTSTSSTNASISATGSTGLSTADSSGTTSSSSRQSSSSGGASGNVNITTTGTSDFWDEIVKGLEVIVFGGEGGKKDSKAGAKSDPLGRKLVVNEMAGLIYVTDSSDNMGNISSFLADVESAVKRQVLIQAHIVEVNLKDSFSLGLDWKVILDKATNWTVSQALTPVPATNVFKMSANGDNFALLLDAMKEQGHLNMLSSPKISTMNNQRAVIKLTTKEVSWVTSTLFNDLGNPVQVLTNPQIDEVGIFLDVTPNIDENGVITMQIHPSISEITGTSVSPDKSSSKPIIDVREIDTMVDVRSGQTIVIAGLIVDKLQKTKRSVPLLGDIPYLGAMFSFIKQERSKSELVILLTPFALDMKTIEDILKAHEKRALHYNSDFELINTLHYNKKSEAPAGEQVQTKVASPENSEIVSGKAVVVEKTFIGDHAAAEKIAPEKGVDHAAVVKIVPEKGADHAAVEKIVPEKSADNATMKKIVPEKGVDKAVVEKVVPEKGALSQKVVSKKQAILVMDSERDDGYGQTEQLLYKKAVTAYKLGNCQLAISLFDRLLKKYPQAPTAGDAAIYQQDCLQKRADEKDTPSTKL